MTINSDFKNRKYSSSKIKAQSSAVRLYTLYSAADRLIFIENIGIANLHLSGILYKYGHVDMSGIYLYTTV
jgi:hypothetical protein